VTIVIQLAEAAGIHAQIVGAATLNVAVPPAAGTEAAPVDNVYVQDWLACATVKIWSANAIVPVRTSPVFGSTANATGPAPEPDLPEVMRIQRELVEAVQAQPELLLTANIPLPPEEGYDPLDGLSAYAQTPAWLTVNVNPATEMVPLRDVVTVFACTE
jgi:hypothetical protein